MPASTTSAPQSGWKASLDTGLEHGHSLLSLISALADGVVGCEPLKSAVGIAMEIVEAIQKVRTNRKDCAALSQKTFEVIFTIVRDVQATRCKDFPSKLLGDINEITSVLRLVRGDAISLSAQNFFKCLARRESMADKIKDLNTQLEDALRRFVLSSLVDLRAGNASVQARLKIVQEGITATHAGIDSIRAQLEAHSLSDTPDTSSCDRTAHNLAMLPSCFHIPPLAPLQLFGRDDEVTSCVRYLTGPSPTHIAILGPGGIGKTALALTTMAHTVVKELYQDRRYFLACDAVSTPSMLLYGIIALLSSRSNPSTIDNDPLAFLDNILRNVSGPFLLVLDNFETTWAIPGEQATIAGILARVTGSPHARVILTMRADVAPARGDISWCSICPRQLSNDAAAQFFLSINPDIPFNDRTDMYTLLQELDGLPLAVKLSAELKRSQSCARLLHCWQTRKVSLLTTELTPTRQTSFAVSLSLSLASPVMDAVPEARSLLYLLCHLPEGVKGGIEQLDAMDLGFEDLDGALSAVLEVALATCDSRGDIRILSPIRQYVLSAAYPPDWQQRREALQDYYVGLVDDGCSDESQEAARQILLNEMGNATAVLQMALDQNDAPHSLAEACFSFAELQTSHMPSLSIIDTLIARWDDFDFDIPLGEARQIRAEILWWSYRYDEALTELRLASAQFDELGDEFGVVQCLHSAGDMYRMQGFYERAEPALARARGRWMAMGNAFAAAQCLQSLGSLHRMQCRYELAVQELWEAKDEFRRLGDVQEMKRCMSHLEDAHLDMTGV